MVFVLITLSDRWAGAWLASRITGTLGKTSHGRYVLSGSGNKTVKLIFLSLTLWLFCPLHFIFIPHIPSNLEIKIMFTYDKFILLISPLAWPKAELLFISNTVSIPTNGKRQQVPLSLSSLSLSLFRWQSQLSAALTFWMACSCPSEGSPSNHLEHGLGIAASEFILYHALPLYIVTSIIWL